MKYSLGDIVVTRKAHVCGSNKWEITRMGADIKAKCIKCGREIIVFKAVFDKKVKSIECKNTDVENQNI